LFEPVWPVFSEAREVGRPSTVFTFSGDIIIPQASDTQRAGAKDKTAHSVNCSQDKNNISVKKKGRE
jgi:hypothetical protein